MTAAILVAGAMLVLAERTPRVRFRLLPRPRPHLATDAFYLLTGFVLLGIVTGTWVERLSAEAAAWRGVPWIAQMLCALVVVDLGNYVAHWAMHRFDALWALHKVHHSSPGLDVMATFRSHLGEQLLRRGTPLVGLVLAGMPVDATLAAAGVFQIWAMANHANVRLSLGPLERHLITPRRHRTHHVPATSERNLGTIFTWWDRVRGTLVDAEDPAPGVAFGFPRQPPDYPQDWARQLVEPFRPRRADVQARHAMS